MEVLGPSIAEALSEAGLLPSDTGPLREGFGGQAERDLLPQLIRCWRQAGGAAVGEWARVRAERQVEWLVCRQAAGARLTLGAPDCGQRPVDRWLGLRLYWWPLGVPRGCRVGLASSRLQRALDLRRPWFAALRAACAQIDPRRHLMVTAAATTTCRFVERCAALFRLPWLRLDVAEGERASFAKWGQRIRRDSGIDQPVGGLHVFLSPPLEGFSCQLGDGVPPDAPFRDRAVAALSDRLLVLDLHPRGRLHGLIEALLVDRSWAGANVHIAVGPGLTAPETARQLLDLGALDWRVPPGTERRGGEVRDAASSARNPAPAIVAADLPPAEHWAFLTHCTRRRDGPWPDQTEQEYLDDLILDRAGADHSALAALRRIVRQQRLIASSLGVRGGARVVSFTDVPLAELHRLRAFRPHRGRWDFEPFGICIQRSWLQHHGACPVLYGDQQLWANLAPEERPFFQARQTRAVGDRAINWTGEREWRCVGDVDLRSLPSDAALLFAPSEADAQELARVSPWPVAVTPRPNRRGTAGDHLNGPSRGRTLNGAGRHRTRHRGGFRGC